MIAQGTCKGENNPMYGKHHTEETRRKISEKARLRVRVSKQVVCIDTGELYKSSVEAAKFTCDKEPDKINYRCRQYKLGKLKRKSTKLN